MYFDYRVPLGSVLCREQSLCLTVPPPSFLFVYLFHPSVSVSYHGIQNKLQGLSACVKQTSTLETLEVHILHFFQTWKELRPIKTELLRGMNILHARFRLNVTAIA